jgi:hypothetical protein
MANANGRTPNFESITARKPVISGLGATYTLKEVESGSTILFDRAAGIVITLPLAVPGLTYDFKVTTTITSNAAKVITGAATELLIGTISSNVTTTTTTYQGNGSTHRALSMNGTTTGAILGTSFRITCLSATRWIVEGTNQCSGTVATPFATS